MTVVPAETPQQRIARALAAAWHRHQPEVRERLTQLRRAGQNLQSGGITAEVSTVAASLAHKLSGTLGMYGFPGGTALARELELQFESPAPNAERCLALVDELQRLLFPAE